MIFVFAMKENDYWYELLSYFEITDAETSGINFYLYISYLIIIINNWIVKRYYIKMQNIKYNNHQNVICNNCNLCWSCDFHFMLDNNRYC